MNQEEPELSEVITIKLQYLRSSSDNELIALGLINKIFREMGIGGLAARRVAEWVMNRFGGAE